MGRYYSGDIEGKFWFGVQSSDDASFFGGDVSEPNYLNYYFTEDDLPEVEKGIKTCKKELGQYRQKIEQFFKENQSYNDEKLENYLHADKDKTKTLLEWYARLELGEKIAKCLKDNGSCEFEAEL